MHNANRRLDYLDNEGQLDNQCLNSNLCFIVNASQGFVILILFCTATLCNPLFLLYCVLEREISSFTKLLGQ